MLINVLKLPIMLHDNRGDVAMFNKFGNRVSTGYDDIEGDYVKISLSRLDNANLICVENKECEADGIFVLKTKDGLLKKIKLYINGDRAGYAYIESKYLFGILG